MILKIAVTCPYFYPRIGGVERYAYNISRRLAAISGNEVEVFTSKMSNEGEMPFDSSGLTVIRVRPIIRLSSTPVNPLWIRSIGRLFAESGVTHSLTHTPVPFMSEATILASKLAGIPCIVTCHEGIENRDPILNKMFLSYFYLLQKRALETADGVIVTSETLASTSKHIHSLKNKLSVVPPGVDANVFRPDIDSEWLARKYGLGEGRIVLFVGQMHKASSRKGIDVLIRSFSQVVARTKDAHLVLIGDGDMRAGYETLASSILPDGSFTFAGIVPESEMPLHYRGASLTVLPSVVSEGFGMSLIEAAACGRPTVASNVGGIPFAVQNEVTGLLVNPGDRDGLASAMCTILEDEALARRMGASGRRRVIELFNWDVLARRTYDLLKLV